MKISKSILTAMVVSLTAGATLNACDLISSSSPETTEHEHTEKCDEDCDKGEGTGDYACPACGMG